MYQMYDKITPRRSPRLNGGLRRSVRIKAALLKASAAAAAAATKPVAPSKRKRASKRKKRTSSATTKSVSGSKRTRKNSSSVSNGTTVPPVTKTTKTGLASIVDTTNALGVVDPESGINGSIEIHDNDSCDCMLVLVDPSQNMDKFYILQLIQKKDDNRILPFIVYSRWGRTGSKGQGQCQYFGDFDVAVQCFEKKFQDKTGLDWAHRHNNAITGKYRFIKQNYVEKRNGYSSAKWQYWVGDGVDGKQNGWYDYDTSGSKNVEQLFQEHQNNSRLTSRLVDSGYWTYKVDLEAMTQTNVKHSNKTTRFIRRFTGAQMGKRYIF